VTLGAPEVKNTDAERKGWDGSVKGKKTATEIQADRKAALEKAKAKREAMRKNYVGHVTLIKQ
jgi:2'-5' RNA ligase